MQRLLIPAAVLAGLLVFLVLPGQARAGDFPDDWYFRTSSIDQVRSIEGREAPELALRGWIGEETTLEALRGKIVVLDFWGTWCPPCMRALPHNVEMRDHYSEDQVAFLGIHDAARGHERMAQVAENMKINYPLAIDDGGRSTRAYGVRFWPTYVVIDRGGIIRAAGLTPDHVDSVIDALLKEGPEAGSDGGAETETTEVAAIDPSWLESNAQTGRERFEGMSDEPIAIESETWLNTEPLDLEELRGKVVLLDFWATWCGECLASIPKMNELQAKYAEDGLVVIGVCHARAVERMGSVVEDRGIEYAVCADDAEGTITTAYRVDSWPDYYFIDRSGRLRAADVRNDKIEDVIQALLAEEVEEQDEG